MGGQSFVGGVFILAFSNLMVKILGSIFRIPLGNLIDSDGLGYYQTAYPIYNFLLAISTTGIPVAISKMVAERTELGDYKGAGKVFKISFAMLSVMGILSWVIFFFGSEAIAAAFNNEKAVLSIRALSIALLVVPVVSAFKGYFQGRSDMLPTSLTQFFEQLARVAVGLYLAVKFLPKGKEVAAAGASFGASAGGIVSLIFIAGLYFARLPMIQRQERRTENSANESAGIIIKQMLMIALPIIIGSLVTPMMNMIDAALVKRRLMDAGFSELDALSLFGRYSGMVATVINLPMALTASISMSIVPAVSQAYITRNMKALRSKIVLGTRLSNLIAMPCMVGLMVLPRQVMQLLYPKEPDSIGEILFVMAFSVAVSGLLQTYTAVLQALGKPGVPVINLFLASLFKIIITYVSVAIPVINVKGAAAGTVVTYFAAAVLNYRYIKRMTKINIKKNISFIKPAFMSIVMGIFVKLSYGLFALIISSDRIRTILAIFVGVLVYVCQLLYMGGIHRKELESSSLGRKISKLVYRKTNR